MLRPFRRNLLACVFPRGLGLLKKFKTDSGNRVPVSQMMAVKVWETKNQEAEDRDLGLVERRCPEERVFSI